MIFVTVGTHEQQFDRLVKYMDKWAGENDEKVIIQTGYSKHEPKNCEWRRLYSFDEMSELITEAGIVITHGGPSSFIKVLDAGKIPIIVPRSLEFNEHINDHQLVFCREMAKRWQNIIVLEDVDKLSDVISNYQEIIKDKVNDYKSNNERFISDFEKIVESI